MTLFPLLSSNPELMKRVDMYKLLKITILKFDQNLSDIFADDKESSEEDTKKDQLKQLLALTQSEEFSKLSPQQQKEITSQITALMQSKVQSDVLPQTEPNPAEQAAQAQAPITGGGMGAGTAPTPQVNPAELQQPHPRGQGKNPIAQFAGKISQVLR